MNTLIAAGNVMLPLKSTTTDIESLEDFLEKCLRKKYADMLRRRFVSYASL